jgi:2-polyprenyl-3-methyl-5-hydroxy-6-metoxy-1,4-benzoquinol methylase
VVTVVEEATNPPSDWRSWNGMGWPGILDQLARYLRTGRNTRWPWRRMGPYIQIPLQAMPFQAWEALTNPGAVKHWMQRAAGSLAVDDEMTLTMGDASGTVLLRVTKSVDTGQEFPSYMPYVEFQLRRPSWTAALGGRMWIEPAGLGESLLQIFHYGWEGLDVHDPLAERKLLTDFWVNSAARAQMVLSVQQAPPAGPHGWSTGSGGQPENGHAAPVERTHNRYSSANGHSGSAATPPAADLGATMEFAGRFMGDLSGAMASVMTLLGARLGLFRALAAGPASSAELAERAGLTERYVREWLWCMASAGYVHPDSRTGLFTLPPAHAAVLAFEGSPMCLATASELIPPMVAMLDEVASAFRTGAGIPGDRYPDDLFSAMEHMSATWLDTMLVDHWLPSAHGLASRLERGGKVADVGSGGGRAVIAMARRFRAAEFDGYDMRKLNVARASAAAEEAGVADRVRFHTADAVAKLTAPLDLITMFDVLHDAPDPHGLLTAAYQALEPVNGVLLVLESNSARDPEDNAGPAGTILYATSTLYCLPTAVADCAPGLGTLGLPFEELHVQAGRAGFSTIEALPTGNPLNTLYLLRP